MSLGRALLILLSILPSLQPIGAQVSPGRLSRAHQQWNGPAQCTACHSLGLGAPRFKCLSCHAEIRRRIESGLGYHARVVKRGAPTNACVQCHTEHYGENFNIVKWETSADEFDHRLTGFSLRGRHAGRSCRECHTAKYLGAAARKELRVRDPEHTYLGLSQSCASCHRDEHRGQLASDCLKCHTEQAWRPAPKFDHSAARYALTGRHAATACAKCHRVKAPGEGVQYTGLRFDDCGACHSDPHKSAFRQRCESCHDTAAWKPARVLAAFDHSGTRFPLKGKHGSTGCFRCHRSANFKEPVAHSRCGDCHRDDPHRGQFVGRDCSPCHNEASFRPALYTRADHAHSAFALTGRHSELACAKCHLPRGRETRYKIPFENCLDCHRDPHRGQFQARCESCHSVEAFNPSTFTLVRHQQSRFPLAGAHSAVPCSECHRPPQPLYHFGDLACAACHADPHRSAARQSCETCHLVNSWREVRTFNHDRTAFALTGAHRALACGACHRGPNRSVVFASISGACSSCHEDAHAGQFTGDCARCHRTVSWRATSFDHSTTRFALTGAHENVPCRSCHTPNERSDSRLVLKYVGTPTQCRDCH